MSLKCRCVGCTNTPCWVGGRGSMVIPVLLHLSCSTFQHVQILHNRACHITGDLAVHLGIEGKMCFLLFPNQILVAFGSLVASKCRGKKLWKGMCQAFPCILLLNTFCRLGDLLLLSFHFPWAPTQTLQVDQSLFEELSVLAPVLFLRRLGESKRAKTV